MKHENLTSIRMTASEPMLRPMTRSRPWWNITIARIKQFLESLDVATRCTVETIGLIVGLAVLIVLPVYLYWCWLTS